MLTEPTMDKLRALKLTAMAAAWASQQADPRIEALTFDERLALLVDAETLHRENRRMATALRDAKLKYPNACIEDIEASPSRGLDRAVVRQLATGRWARDGHAMVITGPTGTGKTYLACAFAHLSCRLGMRAVYRRTSRLVDELMLARADGSYPRLLDRLAKFHVLVLDDWGMKPLSAQTRHDLLEVIDDRAGRASTILASQVPPKLWHDHVGDPTVADAICDRLLHTAHRIELVGASMRDPRTARSRAPGPSTVGVPAPPSSSLRDEEASASTPTVVL
jgi:DNA replication protein DnaC